jgi:hypothetical protein
MAQGGRIIDVDESGRVRSVDEPGVRETRERLTQLAWLLDSSIPIPGTRLTIGIDAIIGLIPVLGDLAGVLLSSYILNEASRLGAPRVLLTRMAFNVAVEGIVGMVPLLGDIFDAAWKANVRNVQLLSGWLDEPKKAERSSRAFGLVILLWTALFLGLLLYLGYLVARWLFSLF